MVHLCVIVHRFKYDDVYRNLIVSIKYYFKNIKIK